jgi:hypothetical protein
MGAIIKAPSEFYLDIKDAKLTIQEKTQLKDIDKKFSGG